jgi:type II secretory pathway component PulF
MNSIDSIHISDKNHQRLRLMYWLLFAFVLICAILVQQLIPTFKPLLSSLGDGLPWISKIVLEYYLLIFLLPFYEFAMATMVTLNKTMPTDVQKIFKIIFFIDALTHVCLFSLVGISMYLPLVSMGKLN